MIYITVVKGGVVRKPFFYGGVLPQIAQAVFA
jgi:hypothetical protein